MLKIAIKDQEYNPSILEVIHKCAKENGSKHPLNLSHNEETDEIICKYPVNNSLCTRGYFAVLYLIDIASNDVAKTKVGVNGAWFRVEIIDEQALIRYLLN